jgi:hypothetical protein
LDHWRWAGQKTGGQEEASAGVIRLTSRAQISGKSITPPAMIRSR